MKQDIECGAVRSEGESTDNVLAVLATETLRRRRNKRNLGIAFAVMAAIEVLGTAAMWTRHHAIDFGGLSTLLVIMSGATVGVSNRHKRATRAAGLLKEKRALGPLLEILTANVGDIAISEIARNTVHEIAATLTPDDANLLDFDQQKALYGILRSSPDAQLCVDLLLVLQQIGDQSAIGPLSEIARNAPATIPVDQRERIQDRALISAAAIKFRLAQRIIQTASVTAGLQQEALVPEDSVTTQVQPAVPDGVDSQNAVVQVGRQSSRG